MDKKMITGMAGVYFVAAELSLRKCVVSVTSRSAHGVDILATCGEGEERKTISIQVKASKNSPSFWPINRHAKQETSPTLFYVFVNNVNIKSSDRDYYVVPSKVVAKLMWGARKRWTSLYKSSDERFDQKFLNRWDRLGLALN